LRFLLDLFSGLLGGSLVDLFLGLFLFGFCFFNGGEEWQAVAFGQRHISFFDVGTLAVAIKIPLASQAHGALRLSGNISHIDLGYLDLELRLNRASHGVLVGITW